VEKMSVLSVTYILWLRQLKRFLRSRSRMLSSIGQPLFFLLAFWFGFGSMYQKAGGGNYLLFIAPGIIAMSILFTAIFTGIEVIWDKQFGFLKETLVAPVSRLNIVAGRALGSATVALMQGIIVFIITLLVGYRPESWAMLPLAFLFMFLIGLMFTAFGTALGSLLDDMHAFPIITNFIVMPMFFLSGALFPLDGLPKAISWLVKINPLSYGVDGLRASLGAVSYFGIHIDLIVVAASIAVLSALCAYLFSRIQA
jgi:ABC-2 type transport system permease protein